MKKIINKRYLRSEWNRRVHKEYRLLKIQENDLQQEAKENAERNGCDAYIEIPSYFTLSGHAEIIR